MKKILIKFLVSIVAMVVLGSTVWAEEHIRKAGEDIDYYAGYTYSGTVEGGSCDGMRVQLNFGFSGSDFSWKFGTADYGSHDGSVKTEMGRIDTTPGISIYEAGVGTFRGFDGDANVNTLTHGYVQWVAGEFYGSDGQVAKVKFGLYDWSAGWFACRGTVSIQR